ncbi:AGE family epimerase/isomerase [Pseudomonas sp. HR96]|uniref:D-mannose isomerase n=1 Tax=Pseudomonas sp. HR96 TaxID=1027966 RepID=UPI002A7624A2|nr:AGE family epimerase/isomerase [Pseudomonas sp. HR96]WPO97724.1 AGE family epimerase/isomerase [Pseudomonas sp. HR96]
MTTSQTTAGDHAWLRAQALPLLQFSRQARLPVGFGALDRFGQLPAGALSETMQTARMVHSFAIAHLQGVPFAAELVDHGLAALIGPMRDARYGGWFAIADAADGDTRKPAYLHAFVALAASSAVVAQRPGAAELLREAVAVLEKHFWSEEEGALLESWNREWTELEAYRGGNSNMHATEAFLALADVLDDSRWLDRALRISERVIHQHASAAGYLPVEHFDAQWQPLPAYNDDNRADGFRPYGQTPGHGFEWARLLLHLEAARQRAGLASPTWLAEDAAALFEASVRLGWAVDGAPGIVYTIDWNGAPVVRERLHWTLAEASAAAAALHQRTGQAQYEAAYRMFWQYIDQHLIDREHGSWHHELDPANQPAERIWAGKPDLYHAYQATLLPQLPLAPSLASGVALQQTAR